MSEDWLDPAPPQNLSAAPSALPAVLPADPAARLQLVQECWSRLTESQKKFLTAYRDNGLNARKANRAQRGRDETYSAHTQWMRQADYATVVRIWRGEVADDALNRDRLLARHDDIVETLLTPKPVLYQGVPVRDTRDPSGLSILEEVDAGAAARANETLMKAAGLLKDKADVEVNVGMMGPGLEISVMQPNGEKRSLKAAAVPVPELPPPIDVVPEPVEDDWLA